MKAIQPSRKIFRRKGPSDWYVGEMCVLRMVFIRVKNPISFVTKGQFNDCIAAKKSVERRENLPFDSTDFAVF